MLISAFCYIIFMTSSYLTRAIRFPNQTATQIIRLIERKNLVFNAIAVRGVSGIYMGAIVSARLKMPTVIVRKESEKIDSHAHTMVEWCEERSPLFGMKYLIIDDLISGGNTVLSIKNAIAQVANETMVKPICVGVILYAHGRDSDEMESVCARQSNLVGSPVYMTEYVPWQEMDINKEFS